MLYGVNNKILEEQNINQYKHSEYFRRKLFKKLFEYIYIYIKFLQIQF